MGKCYIDQRGLIVSRSLVTEILGVDGAKKLLNSLTVRTMTPFCPIPQITLLYENITGKNGAPYIRFPRSCAKRFGVPIECKMPPFRPMFLDNRPIKIGALSAGQEVIVNHLMRTVYTAERIAAGTATALINVRAGYGKTYIAAELISRIGARTLCITVKKPLQAQMITDLRAFLHCNIQPMVGGNVAACESHDVTVVIINTALMQPPEFFAKYSLIIFDEVHEFCSPTRRNIFKMTNVATCLGMSATTDQRSDGFDIVAHKELAYDGVIMAENIPGFAYDEIAFDGVIERWNYYGPPEFTKRLANETTEMMSVCLMNHQFAQDPARNALIVERIKELYDWRGPNGQMHCIYVFAETLDMLDCVWRELRMANLAVAFDATVKDEEVTKFVGGIKEGAIKKAAEEARILLSTYGYAGTGVSIARMTALIFATSRKAKMDQILGRILRRNGDPTIQRRIIDIVDMNTPMKSQFSARKLTYAKNNYQIIKHIRKADADIQ